MSRRFKRSRADTETPGEDSFLDIVANLVGVLIILVVVVGAHAGSQIHKIAISEIDQAELEELKEKHKKATLHAQSLQTDNRELEVKITLEKKIANARKTERDRMLVQLELAQQELDQRKEKLTQEHQKVFEVSTQLASLREEFRSLDSQYTSLKSTTSKKETIEHYPTPIAKTVFSDELHFRLQKGRLVYVPMTELVDSMRNEWKEKARKLETADETTETVGPIGEFRLQYQLRAETRPSPTSYGREERVTSFTRFILVPLGDDIGVPLEQALAENSDFQTWIGLSTPEKTTVSVWVYPDSFEEFNKLKKWLYRRGFRTACWPLSSNNPISGGPSGYRSTAQ